MATCAAIATFLTTATITATGAILRDHRRNSDSGTHNNNSDNSEHNDCNNNSDHTDVTNIATIATLAAIATPATRAAMATTDSNNRDHEGNSDSTAQRQ